MGNEWNYQKLNKYAYVYSGYSFKSQDLGDSGIPVVKIKNVNNRIVDINETQFYPAKLVTDKLEKFFLNDGDVLIAMTGQGSVGRVGRLRLNNSKKVLLNQRVGKFVVKEGLDIRYLYYVISSPVYEKILFDTGTGSGQPNLSPDLIGTIEIPLPPLSEQKAIAHILGSLDDKIELNRKMNQTLEAMAQALFKSWFVDFDPVIDNTLATGNEIPDELTGRAEKRKALGDKKKPLPEDIQMLFPNEFVFSDELDRWIPKGWESGYLSDILEVKYGKDHKKLEDGDIPVYGSGGLMRYVNQSLFSGESVLIPRKGTLSNIMYVNEEFWTVDTMFYTTMKIPYMAKYIYYFVNSLEIHEMNVGSAVPSMTTKVLNSLLLIIPDTNIMKEFDNLLNAYFCSKDMKNQENESLSTIRDTLLPKLLSGEISIEDAEEFVGGVV